jgi:uncharacterized protein YndB with AHSA1/START domain
MAVEGKNTVEQNGNTLTLSRIFDAPKELVFSMFSNPDYLEKWWGPTEWPATIVSFEFKPDGVWHYYMQGPDGTKAWGKTTFTAIDEPNKITYVDAFSNEEGTVDESLPQSSTVLTFEDVDGKTLLTTTSVYESAEKIQEVINMGMLEGVADTWNQLDVLIATNK